MAPASPYPPEIQALLDKQAIAEVLTRYTRGADRGDADLIAAAYHDDATEDHGEEFDTLTLARAIDRFEKRDGLWKIAARRLAWEWHHEMPMRETWARGLITGDPSVLVRGAKKPDDVLYQVSA